MSRYQPALVGDRPAKHWEFRRGFLVLRTPDGLAEIRVPCRDLDDEDRMDGHFARMRSLVTLEQAEELEDIVEGRRK